MLARLDLPPQLETMILLELPALLKLALSLDLEGVHQCSPPPSLLRPLLDTPRLHLLAVMSPSSQLLPLLRLLIGTRQLKP